MFSAIYRYLNNSNFTFLIAFLLALISGDYASSLRGCVLPAIILIMSLSTARITVSELLHFRNYAWDIFIVFAINYIFLSGIILLANQLFIKDYDLYRGFVVMAAIPSAAAVMPFTLLLKGEMMVSLMGSIGLYLLALIMAPLISFQILDVGRIEPLKLTTILIQLIFIPFLISRILLKWKAFHRVTENTPLLVNLAFFLVIYVVIGMNRATFLTHFDVLIFVSLIAFLRTFVSGHAVDLFSRILGTDRDRRMSYVLFGSFKNLAVVAAISIALFNERAAIPAAVTIPFEILFFIWFNYFQRRWG